jgi:4-hydroxy-3-methylbut-2-enyl diphosphate reductase
MSKKIIIVEPHGFCSGVARAVETAERVIERYAGEPVFCLNEIVHNRQIVGGLRDRGMIFVSSVEDVPEGARVLLSAHGVSPQVKARAAERSLRVVDVVCPFVSKVHAEVRDFSSRGMNVICIGHRSHEEVVGVVGEAPDAVCVVESVQEAELLDFPSDVPIGVVTQTTLGAAQVDAVMDVLVRRFSDLQVPGSTDVCYATRNRQKAVQKLAVVVQRVLVVGSSNSSNSRRLMECAEAGGTESVLITELRDLDELGWNKIECVGVTSGASTPEAFLDAVVSKLQDDYSFGEPEVMVAVEERSHRFRMPDLR